MKLQYVSDTTKYKIHASTLAYNKMDYHVLAGKKW